MREMAEKRTVQTESDWCPLFYWISEKAQFSANKLSTLQGWLRLDPIADRKEHPITENRFDRHSFDSNRILHRPTFPNRSGFVWNCMRVLKWKTGYLTPCWWAFFKFPFISQRWIAMECRWRRARKWSHHPNTPSQSEALLLPSSSSSSSKLLPTTYCMCLNITPRAKYYTNESKTPPHSGLRW